MSRTYRRVKGDKWWTRDIHELYGDYPLNRERDNLSTEDFDILIHRDHNITNEWEKTESQYIRKIRRRVNERQQLRKIRNIEDGLEFEFDTSCDKVCPGIWFWYC